VLGRTPRPEETGYWVTQIQKGMNEADMIAAFVTSPEYYANKTAAAPDWVKSLYQDLLGREGSDAEVQTWLNTMAAGATAKEVTEAFLLSDEFLSRVVEGFYTQILQRTADEQGMQYWIDRAKAQELSYALMAASIMASDEFYQKANAAAEPLA